MKMKTVLIVVTFLLVNFLSHADVRKGKCQFTGSEPHHVLTNVDGMEVYYSGEFYMKGTSGDYHIFSGNGTIWIIFHNKKGYDKFKFNGSASIQTCLDF